MILMLIMEIDLYGIFPLKVLFIILALPDLTDAFLGFTMILRVIFIILTPVPYFFIISVIQTNHRQLERFIKDRLWHKFYVLIHIELNSNQSNNFLCVFIVSNGNPVVGEETSHIFFSLGLDFVIDEGLAPSLDVNLQLALFDLFKKFSL